MVSARTLMSCRARSDATCARTPALFSRNTARCVSIHIATLRLLSVAATHLLCKLALLPGVRRDTQAREPDERRTQELVDSRRAARPPVRAALWTWRWRRQGRRRPQG